MYNHVQTRGVHTMVFFLVYRVPSFTYHLPTYPIVGQVAQMAATDGYVPVLHICFTLARQ